MPALGRIARIRTAHADQAAGEIHVDLADLRGYHYYTGATFSVFAADSRGVVVDCGRGGRYDGVGRAFGRARPATGFTLDLRRLAALAGNHDVRSPIIAPDDSDPALAHAIEALRGAGDTVVVALPDEGATIQHAARILARDGNEWRVVIRRQE